MLMRRLLLADDSEAVRLAIKSLLQKLAPEWEVSGNRQIDENDVGPELFAHPDGFLGFRGFAGSKGLWAAETLKDRTPFCRAILISEQDPAILARLEAESGFLCLAKTQLASRLVPALRDKDVMVT
jgi:DNA-binding NarL/FixJ family response regulator